ncbi:hypothetical protein ACFV6F_16870 [Kitasatospora phosalacinea]|uniref:hypothetical protein n=1 Tax=Kitasatospora phosalacinea TaxID=2065 RepID=UPI0036650976
MAKCKNAARAIAANTVRNLYADAAGRCQNPECLSSVLIRAKNGIRVNVGEMAHIIAASNGGPRPNPQADPNDLALEENLILLCLKCHKLVDSQESAYPIDLLASWKSQHEDRISQAFGVHVFATRTEARSKVEHYLDRNRATFETFGPYSDSAGDPYSDAVEIWHKRIHDVIIPNNRILLAIADANVDLLDPDERRILEKFRIHAEEFERRHIFDTPSTATPRFPMEMNNIFR